MNRVQRASYDFGRFVLGPLLLLALFTAIVLGLAWLVIRASDMLGWS